jgi:hydrogenase maturation protease
MTELEGSDILILIDAAAMGNEPCTVAVLPLGRILTELPYSGFSHHYDLLHAMKLQNYQGDGILLAVEACSIRYRFGLSPQMQAQLPRIVDEVDKHIENFFSL